MVSQKKIAIIGLGGIGTAHLRSFLKLKNINYFLVDQDKKKLLRIKKIMIKERQKSFLLSNKLPENMVFDFVIISTDPKDRFTIFKKITEKNKIKTLLFEKFLFNNLRYYKKTQNILEIKKIKSYVNIWSKLLIDRLRLNFYKNKNKIEIKISMSKNSILTNLIHFYALFFDIGSKKKIKINLNNFRLKSGKYYANGNGEIVFNDDKNNKMIINDKYVKKNDFSMVFKYKSHIKEITFSKGKLFQKGRNKATNFPLSSEITSKFFLNLVKKKKNIGIPEYKKVSIFSVKILKSFQKFYKKQIRFR